MSDANYEDKPIPVKVVEPLPSRGRREIIQTKFTKYVSTRGDCTKVAVLCLPERPGRIEAYIINNNGGAIQIGNAPNVTNWLGTEIPGAATSPKISGSGPVYFTVDPGVGQPTDSVVVSSVDNYIVPYDRMNKQSQERSVVEGRAR